MSKYEAVWTDRYITNIVLDRGNYRLEGNRLTIRVRHVDIIVRRM